MGYKIGATVTLPFNYPDQPPLFTLKVLQQPSQSQNFLAHLTPDLLDKIDSSDLKAVEALRNFDNPHHPWGEPLTPILLSL